MLFFGSCIPHRLGEKIFSHSKPIKEHLMLANFTHLSLYFEYLYYCLNSLGSYFLVQFIRKLNYGSNFVILLEWQKFFMAPKNLGNCIDLLYVFFFCVFKLFYLLPLFGALSQRLVLELSSFEIISMLCGYGVARSSTSEIILELLIVEICSSKVISMLCGCGVVQFSIKENCYYQEQLKFVHEKLRHLEYLWKFCLRRLVF